MLHRLHIKEARHATSRTHESSLTCFPERERLYGKDMHCPSEWRDWVKTSDALPSVVVPGATGDVLPETVETLMSYLGISDTCTHNLLCTV
jgi:hypothetical protein